MYSHNSLYAKEPRLNFVDVGCLPNDTLEATLHDDISSATQEVEKSDSSIP